MAHPPPDHAPTPMTLLRKGGTDYLHAIFKRKLNESKRDIKKFSRRFNGSQNKGYFYAAGLVGRKK